MVNKVSRLLFNDDRAVADILGVDEENLDVTMADKIRTIGQR